MSSNLVSLADRTTDEQREIARKGGIASGEARRERRKLRDALEALLSMRLGVEWVPAELSAAMEAAGCEDVDAVDVLAMAAFVKASEGDMRAMEFIRDTVGEKPRDEASISVVSDELREQIIREHDEAGFHELLEQFREADSETP